MLFRSGSTWIAPCPGCDHGYCLYGNYLLDRCLQTGLYYCFGHLRPVGSLHDPVPLRWDRAYPDPDLNPDLSRSPPELEGMGHLCCCDSSHRDHHLLDHFDDPHDLVDSGCLDLDCLGVLRRKQPHFEAGYSEGVEDGTFAPVEAELY